MKKYDFKLTLVVICVSYTIVSLVGGVINLITWPESGKYFGNTVMMFVWSTIAVLVIFSHAWFEQYSPLAVIIVQYIVAQGLVFLMLAVSGFFTEIHLRNYWEAFRSFVIPYAIGAAIYYISNYLGAKKSNKMLQEIKAKKRAATSKLP